MFNHLIWQPDRMLLGDLVFRLEHFKADSWDGTEHFAFYKIKGLIDQYDDFFGRNPVFRPNNIFELGIYDGGSTAFWFETFHPKQIVAIDILDREDSPYFRKYVTSRQLSKRISTYWRVDQADKPRLREIVSSEFDEGLDLVLDDCSHLYAPTLASFEALFPFLSPGGLYIIEDWAWGHWAEYFQPDHVWANEEPLTNLVVKFIEAIGTSSRLINCITVKQGFIAIEKSAEPIPSPIEFTLEHQIARRPAKASTKPISSNSSPRYQRWLEWALPLTTSRRRIYERIRSGWRELHKSVAKNS